MRGYLYKYTSCLINYVSISKKLTLVVNKKRSTSHHALIGSFIRLQPVELSNTCDYLYHRIMCNIFHGIPCNTRLCISSSFRLLMIHFFFCDHQLPHIHCICKLFIFIGQKTQSTHACCYAGAKNYP